MDGADFYIREGTMPGIKFRVAWDGRASEPVRPWRVGGDGGFAGGMVSGEAAGDAARKRRRHRRCCLGVGACVAIYLVLAGCLLGMGVHLATGDLEAQPPRFTAKITAQYDENLGGFERWIVA